MAFFRLSQDETLKSRSLLGIFILLTQTSAFHFIWSGFIPKSCKNVTCERWQVCENCDVFLPPSSTWVGGDMEDNTDLNLLSDVHTVATELSSCPIFFALPVRVSSVIQPDFRFFYHTESLLFS